MLQLWALGNPFPVQMPFNSPSRQPNRAVGLGFRDWGSGFRALSSGFWV